MAKRGRPRLPVETHIMRGTYRPDRHGPRPALHGVQMPTIRPSGPPINASEADQGAAFTAALLRTWAVDDVVGLQHATAAGAALDRLAALDALLDGPDGLMVRAAAGSVSASHLVALLTARKHTLEAFHLALEALELDKAAPAAFDLRLAR